jgi:hypothetical protein
MSQGNDVAEYDVMQVCRNGHVITDLLTSCPELGLLHCERCGSPTLDHCLTCGQKIRGAIYVPGLVPAGSSPPPSYCASCGAPFPWTNGKRRPPASNPRAALEAMLRRLPLVVRQLRWRQGELPPFRVDDERDLEDLLRALLPLHFDDIRPIARTPSYATGRTTDFLLLPQGIALTTKLARPSVREASIAEQFKEDTAFHRGQGHSTCLLGFIYDPDGLLREPSALERAWSSRDDNFEILCVVAAN